MLGFVFVVVFGLFVLQLLSGLTEKQRLAAVAAVKKPESVAFYEALATEAKPAGTVEPAVARDDAVALSDCERMARWARLFERVRQELSSNAAWETLRRWPFEIPPRNWADVERKQAETFVSGLSEILEEIHALAALGGPVVPVNSCDYYGRRDHCNRLQTCAHLLRFEAGVLATGGDHEGAAESIVAILRLGHALADEPFLAPQQFRTMSIRWASDTLSLTFALGELPPGAMPSLQEELAQINGHDSLAALLSVHFHRRIEMRRTNWSGRSLSECVAAEGLREGTAGWLWTGPVCRPLFNQDEQIFAELTNRLIATAHIPYFKAKPELDRIAGEVAAMLSVRSYAKEAMPRLSSWYIELAFHESMVHLMQLGIAVETHYAERGAYPPALDSIAGLLPDGLPIDPFSGQPYHYTPGEDTFLLYGVGSDCEDDGGESTNYNDGDMVWRGN